MADSVMSSGSKGPTRHSTAGSATAKVIDQGSIALDGAVNGQIAAVASIRYFLVFEKFDGSFNSLDSRTPSFECFHAYTSSPIKWYVSVIAALEGAPVQLTRYRL